MSDPKYIVPFIGIIGVMAIFIMLALIPVEPKKFAPPPFSWMKDTIWTQPYVSEDKPDSLQWKIEPLTDEPDNY